ncbi:CDP-glycerol--glycerophosphate glycerophosphotransferase [Vibrio rumoiensis]|uniref:CDP-glycerol--glycerophosphate glycerophosphotransferase n=1 Tax=Vibrio rumoiensis TaxID=76258 RepID=UPI0015725E4F|nr:CDP-glycerol--glycerophosphate glycerophosphotransferase [Vibrio rumoiensis]
MNNKKYLMYISQNYSYAILRPLQHVIRQQGGEVRWFFEGKEANPSFLKNDEVRLNSIEEVKGWNPDAVFVPGNIVPRFIPGVKVGVFHGFHSGKRQMQHFKIRGCFDLYCTQGPNTTEKFQELAKEHGFFKVKETGWSTLDPLFTPITDNPYVDKSDTRSTILLCSTFTERLSCAETIFDTIKELSQTGKWRWLVQFHPKMAKSTVDKYKSIQNENLTFIETDDVIPLLQAADVMLCDTSSILLMFLLQRKPVVTFNNQIPLDHLLNITQVNEIEQSLELALSHPVDLMSAIDSYCEELHPYTDGKSSERVIAATNELIEQGLAGLKKKPLNFVRHYKLRKKLNYWKLK